MVKMSSEVQHPQKLTWNPKKLTIVTIVDNFLPQVSISKALSRSHYPFTVKINKDSYYVACGLHTKVLKENKP